MPTPATVSRSRWIVASHSSITPRSSWYSSPGLDLQRAARVALEVLDLLGLRVGPAHERRRRGTTYQSGIRCGQPRGPSVAQVTTRSSSRNARTSSSVIWIWSRRLTRAEAIGISARARPRWRRRCAASRTASRASSGSSTAASPASLRTSRTSQSAPANGSSTMTAPSASSCDDACAPRAPSGRARARSTRARARRRDLAGARPALDVGGWVDLGPRLEASRRAPRRRLMRSRRKWRTSSSRRVEGRDVPALAAVDQRVRLDRALGELVLVLLVVLEAQQPAAGDRARETTRAISESSPARARDLQALLHRVARRARRRSSRAPRSASPRGCARRSGRSRRPAPWPRPAAAARGGRSCRSRARGRPRSRRRRATSA